MQKELTEIVDAYLAAALWSTTDNAEESGGEPLDANYSVEDLDDSVLETAQTDCRALLDAHGDLIQGRYEQAGHDLWLTRNRHGCGFWETPDWKEADGEILTEFAQALGEYYLIIGDDGKIYGNS